MRKEAQNRRIVVDNRTGSPFPERRRAEQITWDAADFVPSPDTGRATIGTSRVSTTDFMLLTAAGLVSACEVAHPHSECGPSAPAPASVRTTAGSSAALEDYVLGSHRRSLPQNAPSVDRVSDAGGLTHLWGGAWDDTRRGFDLCGHLPLQRSAGATDLAVSPHHDAAEVTAASTLASGPSRALPRRLAGTRRTPTRWGGPRVPYSLAAAAACRRGARERTSSVSLDDLSRLNADARAWGAPWGPGIQKRDASGRAGEILLEGTPTGQCVADVRAVSIASRGQDDPTPGFQSPPGRTFTFTARSRHG